MEKQRQTEFGSFLRRKFATSFAVLVSFFVVLWFVPSSFAQEQGQRTFTSAREASRALFIAARQQNGTALLEILGPTGKDVISSGDAVEDMNARLRFVDKYAQMHRFARETDGTTILYVGAENWPFPIPLADKNGRWYFDTAVGEQEILMRRIGKNELAAINACHQLVDAEQQYYARAFHGQHDYAQRFVSKKGRHDGLFWSDPSDEWDSRLDPLIAEAGEENATGPIPSPTPFNGYFFRTLTAQGADASGGAKSYIANGKMVGGFAFEAYPVEYRSSGVMTFIVNQDDVVYEKDLGPDTTKLANATTDYNPNSTWRRVD